jgi:hypothetical protein
MDHQLEMAEPSMQKVFLNVDVSDHPAVLDLERHRCFAGAFQHVLEILR